MLRSYCLILVNCILFTLVIISSVGRSAELAPIDQSIHQQERQRALEERLAPSTPDV